MGSVIPAKAKAKAVANFKDRMGRYRTQSLFLETNDIEDKYPSYFTLKPYDYKGRISLRRKYLEIQDPTEYLFATQTLGYWEHWQKLTGLSWFSEYVEEWRRELEMKIRSEAVEKIQMISENEAGATGLSASKWLAERKYLSSPGTKRGRPSNDEKEGIKQQIKEDAKVSREDAVRIGLVED